MTVFVVIGFLLAVFWVGVEVFWIFPIIALFYVSWIIRFVRFFRLVYGDLWYIVRHGSSFAQYGCSIYCGRQGDGKTMAITEYLERMRRKYPKCLILTNFGFVNEDAGIDDWQDLLLIRNCTDGVIFAIDEIQNEYNSTQWQSFPESLLREITQQRKQRVKIILSSQVYSRVVKQLREQCFEVIECRTLLGRWVFLRAYDAEDYNAVVDRPEVKQKLRRVWRYNFLQTNELRGLYDSYAKIDRLRRTEFVPRNDR